MISREVSFATVKMLAGFRFRLTTPPGAIYPAGLWFKLFSELEEATTFTQPDVMAL